MVRDFQKRLSIKHGIITRKILDNNIELEGTPQDCIRIRYKKTKDGDTEAWELLMADIQSIYFPPLDEVPFRKLKDNGEGKYKITSLVDSYSDENVDKYKLIFTHKSDLMNGDLIIRVFHDPDVSEPIILVFELTELLGPFGDMLESQSANSVLCSKDIPDEIAEVVSEMAKRRLKLGF